MLTKPRGNALRLTFLMACSFAMAAVASTDTMRVVTAAPGDGHSLANTPITILGGDGDDDSRSVVCDPHGGCTLYGYTDKSFGDSTDLMAVHLTPLGVPDWARTYGGTNRDELRYAVKAGDGGALLVGMTSSLFYTSLKVFSPSRPPRPFLVRIDKDGNVQWSMTIDLYGPNVSRLDFERSIQVADGSFLLVGDYMVAPGSQAHAAAEHDWTWKDKMPDTGGKGYATMAVMKLGTDGHVIWLKRYSVPAGNSAAWGAEADADGHILLLGHVSELNNLAWVNLDNDGHPSSAQIMTEPAVALPTLITTPDGGRLVFGWAAGGTGKPGGLFAARYSPKGEILWTHGYFYALPLASMEGALDAANRLCVVGRLNGGKDSRAFAVSLDADGKLTSAATLGDNKPTEFTGVSMLPDGRWRLLGDTYDYDAKNADLISLAWDSGKDPDGLAGKFARSDFTPKFVDTTVAEATADIAGIHLLPATAVLTQSIPLPTAAEKQH